MKLKLLVRIACNNDAHNAGDEIASGDGTAKLFIDRNIAEPTAAKPAKETA